MDELLIPPSIGVKFGGGKNTSHIQSVNTLMNLYLMKLENFAQKNVLYNVLRIGMTDTKFHKKR